MHSKALIAALYLAAFSAAAPLNKRQDVPSTLKSADETVQNEVNPIASPVASFTTDELSPEASLIKAEGGAVQDDLSRRQTVGATLNSAGETVQNEVAQVQNGVDEVQNQVQDEVEPIATPIATALQEEASPIETLIQTEAGVVQDDISISNQKRQTIGATLNSADETVQNEVEPVATPVATALQEEASPLETLVQTEAGVVQADIPTKRQTVGETLNSADETVQNEVEPVATPVVTALEAEMSPINDLAQAEGDVLASHISVGASKRQSVGETLNSADETVDNIVAPQVTPITSLVSEEIQPVADAMNTEGQNLEGTLSDNGIVVSRGETIILPRKIAIINQKTGDVETIADSLEKDLHTRDAITGTVGQIGSAVYELDGEIDAATAPMTDPLANEVNTIA